MIEVKFQTRQMDRKGSHRAAAHTTTGGAPPTLLSGFSVHQKKSLAALEYPARLSVALGSLSGREEQGLSLDCQNLLRSWECCTVAKLINGKDGSVGSPYLRSFRSSWYKGE